MEEYTALLEVVRVLIQERMQPLQVKQDLFNERLSREISQIEDRVTLANAVLQERLQGLNGAQRSMADFRSEVRGMYLTTAEHAAFMKMLESKEASVSSDIRLLRESRAELAGKASQSQVIVTFLIAILSVIISVVSFLHTK